MHKIFVSGGFCTSEACIASAIVSISVSILPNERLVQILLLPVEPDSISIHEIPVLFFSMYVLLQQSYFLRTHAPESCVKSYAVFTPCFSSFAACLRPIPHTSPIFVSCRALIRFSSVSVIQRQFVAEYFFANLFCYLLQASL